MNVVYYYEGMPEIADANGDGLIDNNKLNAEKFLGNDGKLQQGIRKILHDRNLRVLSKIEKRKLAGALRTSTRVLMTLP